MKPIAFQVPRQESESVKAEHDKLPHFYDSLHVHHDYQLTFIKKSYGTLYVGDQIIPFEEGDVFMLGCNLPHVFKNDPLFYNSSTISAESYSLYFQYDFARIDFNNLHEYEPISILLAKAENGLKIEGPAKMDIVDKLPRFYNLPPLEKILGLLELLHTITKSAKLKPLANTALSTGRSTNDSRIRAVFDHLINHYHEYIPLSLVASIANMTETSFCRYFKQHTRKTFSQYLTEVRIEAACKKLLSGKFSVAQVCYNTGFNNLSNFNRQFKYVTGYAPREYIRQQLEL